MYTEAVPEAHVAEYGGKMWDLARLRDVEGSLRLARSERRSIYSPSWLVSRNEAPEISSPVGGPWHVDVSTFVMLQSCPTNGTGGSVFGTVPGSLPPDKGAAVCTPLRGLDANLGAGVPLSRSACGVPAMSCAVG